MNKLHDIFHREICMRFPFLQIRKRLIVLKWWLYTLKKKTFVYTEPFCISHTAIITAKDTKELEQAVMYERAQAYKRLQKQIEYSKSFAVPLGEPIFTRFPALEVSEERFMFSQRMIRK